MSGDAPMPQHNPMSGGCQCGAVRYRLDAAPEDIHFCHCRMCQKAVGNVFAALAPVRRPDLMWTRGTPAEFQSSSAAVRQFCAHCGTPLSFAYVHSDWIAVTIGSLDQPALARPEHHYGVESRIAWLHDVMSGDTPAAPTDPGAKILENIVNFQHPDHDTSKQEGDT